LSRLRSAVPLPRGTRSALAALEEADVEEAEEDIEDMGGVADDGEGPPLYFGGATEERRERPEESEAQRVASRINEALAMRRLPKPAPLAIVETGWYEELGIEPTATQEEITLRYLEHAEDLEERLAYLLEGAEDEEDEDEDEEDDEEAEEGERKKIARDKAIALQPDVEGLAEAVGEDGAGELAEEAENVSLEFLRLSNLYQILSVPELRRMYDEGGVEGLASRVPQLHKGLLEPERVLRMARGLKDKGLDARRSLLLRKEPRTPTFARYQAANSIKQVLRRMTDVFRVWCFKSGKSLKHREGTIYTELPEVGIFGRVNAGKSALIQHLLSAGRMRKHRLASSAQTPGKTQGIDVFCVNRRFTLADMPGYGRGNDDSEMGVAIRRDWKEKWEPLQEEYLNTTRWLRAAIYVHDISKDVTRCDMDQVEMLKKHNIPTLLVFTKDDKVDSDTHRMSRVRRIRKGLRWPLDWPHAHYTTRRGGYGQVFKNMVGTMLLGLLATEQKEDAWHALENELPEIFMDYRDKWVPRPRGQWGKLPKEKKVRTYPNEDKVYTDEDLEREQAQLERQEMRKRREEQKAAGIKRTLQDDIEEVAGPSTTPKDRRRRWEEMLEAAKR